MELLLNRCSNGANLCAVSATDAFICVDNVDVALGDAGNGAFAGASAACDASVSNLVSHLIIPP
jgi:hypothetical protein